MKFSGRKLLFVGAAALAMAAISFLMLSSDRVLPRNNSFTMWIGLSNAPAALLTPFEADGITRKWSIFAVLSFIQWLLIFWFAPGLFRKWRATAPKESPAPQKPGALAYYRVGNIVFVMLVVVSLMMLAFSADTGMPTGVLGLLTDALFYTGIGFYSVWLLGFIVAVVSRFFTSSQKVHLYCSAIPFWVGATHVILWAPMLFIILK